VQNTRRVSAYLLYLFLSRVIYQTVGQHPFECSTVPQNEHSL